LIKPASCLDWNHFEGAGNSRKLASFHDNLTNATSVLLAPTVSLPLLLGQEEELKMLEMILEHDRTMCVLVGPGGNDNALH